MLDPQPSHPLPALSLAGAGEPSRGILPYRCVFIPPPSCVCQAPGGRWGVNRMQEAPGPARNDPKPAGAAPGPRDHGPFCLDPKSCGCRSPPAPGEGCPRAEEGRQEDQRLGPRTDSQGWSAPGSTNMSLGLVSPPARCRPTALEAQAPRPRGSTWPTASPVSVSRPRSSACITARCPP